MPPLTPNPVTDDRGAAIVELALVLPVFLSLVLGMFTGGIIFNRQIEVTHSAREGGRYGALLPVDEAFATGTWATTVQDVVVARSDEQLEAAEVCVALVEGTVPVAVSADHSTRSGDAPCFDDSSSGTSEPRVQVQATTSGTLETMFFTKEVAVTATVTARHEGLG